MIINTSDVKSIYLCSKRVDFRKQIDGLVGLIEFEFNHDVIDGSLYVFVNARKDKLKVIYYDGSGFWMLVKRMEKGKFQNEFNEALKLNALSERQLKYLLEGLKFDEKYIDKLSSVALNKLNFIANISCEFEKKLIKKLTYLVDEIDL